jgi:hypothetical protein
MMSDDPRYPIGQFHYSRPHTDPERAEAVQKIEMLPARLEDVLGALDPDDWDRSYRPRGWTVREVVHHLPDSHLHAYTRFMFALAQDGATIRPYDEGKWVEVIREMQIPSVLAIAFLRALHARWAAVLRTLSGEDFQRTIIHPEHGRAISVDELLGMYAWHGDHHLAHIESVQRRAA